MAATAAEYTRSQAPYHLRYADDLTRAAACFKRAADTRMDVEQWPIVAAAYGLNTASRAIRLPVDCLLLGGADSRTIEELTGFDQQVVEAFHDLFFDVRGKPELWLCSHLFQSDFAEADRRDVIGIQHRLAYRLGWRNYLAMQTGKLDDAGRTAVMNFARDLLYQQLPTFVLTNGSNPDVFPKLLTAVVGTKSPTPQSTEVTVPANEQHGAVIMGFLRSMPLKVADPTDPANLNLAAREPRASEHLREAFTHIDQDTRDRP